MNTRTILSVVGIAAALAAAGCERRSTPDNTSQGYGKQRQDTDRNYGAPGAIVHPDKGDPTIGGRPGRASGGGLEENVDPANINTKDQFKSYISKRVDSLEDMLDDYKSRGDSLKGPQKDRFDQSVTTAKHSLKNVDDQVGKLDDDNWMTMRPNLESALKKAEADVQRVGTLF